MPTKEQLEHEIHIEKCLKEERKESDRMYAIKLTEKIVFGLLGMAAVVIVGALLATIIK